MCQWTEDRQGAAAAETRRIRLRSRPRTSCSGVKVQAFKLFKFPSPGPWRASASCCQECLWLRHGHPSLPLPSTVLYPLLCLCPCLVIVVVVPLWSAAQLCLPPRRGLGVGWGLASMLRHGHRRRHPLVSVVAYCRTLRGECASGQTDALTPLLSSFSQPCLALSLLFLAFVVAVVCLPWFCNLVPACKSPRHVQYINHWIMS